jgi:ABC-type multidrug transport system fused ATPase/permease subunit
MLKDIFLRFLRENPRYAWINLIFMMLVPINEIYLSRLYGRLFESIQYKQFSMNSFYPIVITMALLQLGFSLSDYMSSNQGVRFQEFCKLMFVERIFQNYKINGVEPNVTECMTKIHKTQQILSDWFGRLFGFFIPITLQLILTVTYFLYIDVTLGVLLLITLFVFGIFMSNTQNTCDGNNKAMDSSLTKIHDRLADIVTNYVSVFKEQRLDNELDQVKEMYTEYGNLHVTTVRCSIKYRLILSGIIIMFLTGFVYRCYSLLKNKLLKYAVFYSLMMVMSNMISNMVYMINLHRDMIFDYIHLRNSGMLENFEDVQFSDQYNCKEVHSEQYMLEVKNLDYVYPNKIFPTLLNLNLSIKPKERVALVGDIGSGKSTFMKLIQRLMNPTNGSIFIRRKCLSTYTVEELYKVIGFMPQNSQIFNRTVYENIIYESPNISRTRVEDTMKRYDIMKNFPNGLDISATTLSGGQRQLVWFLRIYFKNPSLVILDEPTASLDKSTKDLLINLMETMLSEKTILVVTHDAYLAKHMERVVDISTINAVNHKNIK